MPEKEDASTDEEGEQERDDDNFMLAPFDPELNDHSHAANIRKAIRLIAKVSTLITDGYRISLGLDPLSEKPDLTMAGNLFYKLNGEVPPTWKIRMESLAASGGYYVSCGGKYLMANETSITGSIGVIIQTLNYEQLLNKIGLAAVVFKSGKFKDMVRLDVPGPQLQCAP